MFMKNNFTVGKLKRLIKVVIYLNRILKAAETHDFDLTQWEFEEFSKDEDDKLSTPSKKAESVKLYDNEEP